MHHEDKNLNTSERPSGVSPYKAGDMAFPAITLDPEKYHEHLSDLDITDEEAAAFLEVLWNIMHTMVDLGMGLDSVQMFSQNNDQKTGQDSGNDQQLKSKNKLFNKAAEDNE